MTTTSLQQQEQHIKSRLSLALDALNPCWSLIHNLILQYPKALEWRMGGLSDQCSLLHAACLDGAPLDVVKQMVDLRPSLLYETDPYGKVPLHYGILYAHDFAVISFLVERGGAETVLKKDALNQQTTLHYACQSRKDWSCELVELLLRVGGPKMAAVRDDRGRLALHYACREGFSIPAIQLLIKAYPDSTRVRDKDGNRFIDLARRRRENDDGKQAIVRWCDEREGERRKLDCIYRQVREWQPEQMKKCNQELGKRLSLKSLKGASKRSRVSS